MKIRALSLVGLLGCAESQVQKSETNDPTSGDLLISGAEKSALQSETIPAYYAVRVREAEPDRNFYGEPAMIGCSADGFDRYLVRFTANFKGSEVQSAKIVLDALSGTCASSYDSTKCDLEMTVVAYPVRDPMFGATPATWNVLPTFLRGRDPTGTSTFHVPYQGTAAISFDVTEYIQGVTGTMQGYGFELRAANDTETTRREQTLLHDEFHIGRAIQRDVLVGNPRLEVTYK
ncbi:DNRLRE domain-containing protein [Candidatus Woesearchaeota archaeon]|nr:DNRLRE domain-containing protein [Candidatus Woesearchaeota archaeon]